MGLRSHLQNALIGATAIVVAGAHLVPGADTNGPVMRAAVAFVKGDSAAAHPSVGDSAAGALSMSIASAPAALSPTDG